MTLYSTYAVNMLRLTPEGDLSTDEDTAADQLHSLTQCLASGTARALLDLASDTANNRHDSSEVLATQWQTPHEGWELSALDDDMQAAVQAIATKIFAERFHDVMGMAKHLAWHSVSEAFWWHDDAMALYRIGELLGHALIGSGRGFYDYSSQFDADRLNAWMDETGLASSMESYIDSDEEPCLLHGSLSATVLTLTR